MNIIAPFRIPPLYWKVAGVHQSHGPGGNPTPADQQDYNVTTHAHQWQQSVSYCYSMLYFHIYFSKPKLFFIPPFQSAFSNRQVLNFTVMQLSNPDNSIYSDASNFQTKAKVSTRLESRMNVIETVSSKKHIDQLQVY